MRTFKRMNVIKKTNKEVEAKKFIRDGFIEVKDKPKKTKRKRVAKDV